MVREADWSLASPVREELWKEMCRHHSTEKDFSDYYYWDTVKQIYGTTGRRFSYEYNVLLTLVCLMNCKV